MIAGLRTAPIATHEGLQDMEAFAVSGPRLGVRAGAPRLVVVALGSRAGTSARRLRDAAAETFGDTTRIVRARDQMLVTVHELGEGTDAPAFAERVRSRLAQALGDDRLAAGVCAPGGGAGLSTAIMRAEHALLVGRSLFGDARTIPFGALGLYRFVLGRPAPELEAFCEELLGPLATPCSRYDSLIVTLEAYFDHRGNLNGAARGMRVHRNTIQYRLKRIAELTGADLRDADTCLALQLALLARRSLQTMGAPVTNARSPYPMGGA